MSQPAGAYGFGRGWRINFVWVEKNENGQFIHYRSDGKLDYILDSVGRKIQFTYSGNFISSISDGVKTVNYSYSNDELAVVNDGGIQQTRYNYEEHHLKMATQVLSALSIIQSFYNPVNWISVIMGVLPNEREDQVYYLSSVTTPFGGEYKISYTEYTAYRYASDWLSISIMWYQLGKATGFQEVGSAYTKNVFIKYGIDYPNDKPPAIGECDIYEGTNPSETSFTKHTHMLFARYSNSVDEDSSYLKLQTVYGQDGKILSQHLVDIYDTNLEAPTRVIDQTGNRNTIQEFRYDNWGNITWQHDSATQVEAYYAYANTNTVSISHPKSVSSPYGSQSMDGSIHDARIGELVLNSKDGAVIPQQTWYNYDSKGNLLEKAVRWNNAWLKTGYVYDQYGNITKMTSPSGIETYYEYPGAYQNALMTKIILNKLTDADGNVQNNVVLRELGYYPATFRKRWEKDARGYVTEYQYDILGREIMTVLPDDTDGPDYRPTTLTGAIDRSGFRSDNPVQTVEYKDSAKTTTVIDPLGNRTDYIYDSFEHLVEIIKFKKTLGIHTVYSQVKVGYDNQGNIASIISPNGCANPDEAYKYATRYYYDALNRLAKVVYPDDTPSADDNPYKFYDYEDSSNWVTVYDENGNRTLIKKDAVDRIYEQAYAVGAGEGFSTYFQYDALGNKTAVTDGRGATTQFVYDNLNHLTQKILPEVKVLNNPDGPEQSKSSTLRYEYDNEGNLVREVSPLGRVITHTYDEMNREIKTATEFTSLNGTKKTVISKTFYDLAGNKTAVVDPNGKRNEFVYTARGWLKQQKDPAGGVTSFTYDLVGNKISETDPRGNAPGVPVNSYTAWYFYDDLYRVVKAVMPDQTPPSDPNNPGDNPVITFEYDYNGNCIKETKANGQVINYTYNGRNWLLEQSETLNGKTYRTRFEYDKVGNKTVVRDNKNNETKFEYDALNRQIRTWLPEGNTVETFYDANGNKIMTRDGRHNGNDYEYDALNRLKQVTDAEGNVAKFWYDEEGRVTKQESPDTASSPTGQVTKFYLNELGMAKRVVDSMGRSREFDYDVAGNVIYKKDPRGTEANFQYDDLYRLLRQDLQNGTRRQSVSYEYDIVGNIKKASNGQVDLIYNDADGSYISDPFNRIQKVKQVMPDGTSYLTQYRYDDQTGQMTGIRYPNSADWLTYDYDQMGRLVGIPGFARNKTNPGFTYDDNSTLESIKTDNGVVTTYQRDNNGRITDINSGKSGLNVLSLKYVYDDANNIISRNDNSYVYDKVNRLQQAMIRGYFEDKFTKADMLMGKVDQDYHGEREAEEDVTGQTQIKLDYSARSLIFNLKFEAENICRIELVPEVASHRVPTDQLEIYYRNGVGFTKLDKSNWVGTKDDKGKITIRFTPVLTTSEIKIHCNYDDLDYLQMPVDRSEFYNSPEKLVTVYQKFVHRTETYTYDAMGNRTKENILLRKEYGYTYTYYPNSNRLKTKVKDDGSEKFEYAYNENGNLTSKVVTKGNTVDTWEYAYDLLNQLEQVKKNGQVVSSYIYDPNGFRVEKQGSKGKIQYVPLLNGEVGYYKEIENNKEYSFIYVGGQKLARVNGVVGGTGKKFYYHNDHLGSALAITDEYGNKVVERDFAPFGERINVKEDDGVTPDEDDSAFTGKDWDIDVELYYFNARWYDPTVGRFISEDSVADSANNNHEYVYCANNPIINIDPTGNTLGNVIGALGKISQVMNLAAELDPSLKENSSFGNLLKNLNYTRNILSGISSVAGQKNIELNKNLGLVVIKDDEGNVKNAYKTEEMKTDFQKLAALQESKSSEAKDFETIVKDRYKDYFDTVKGDGTGVTVIGLRGWGIGGTKERPTLNDEARKNGEHDYDDMLLVLDPKGNLEAFDQVNFEGSSAKNQEKKGKAFPFPSIVDGKYDLVSWTHDGASEDYQDVMLMKNGSTYLPTKEWNPLTKNSTAFGIEIHKGGISWNWSNGCITIFAPDGDTSSWDRFISKFPSDAKDWTKVGTFSLMTL